MEIVQTWNEISATSHEKHFIYVNLIFKTENQTIDLFV